MSRTATRSAATFAALLGVILHALVLLSTGLAAGAASAGETSPSAGSPFWSLCLNGKLVSAAETDVGEGGQPAAPAHGMPACPLCALSGGFGLIAPELPAVQPLAFSSNRIGSPAVADPDPTRTAVRPPARAPPHIF